MIEMIPAPEPDVVAFRVRGDVDPASFQRVTKDVEDRLTHDDTLRMYAQIEDLGTVPPRVVFDNLRQNLSNVTSIRRLAIVSDQRWLEMMARAQDTLWPKADVRHFGFGEQDEAMQWLLEN